MRKNTSSRGKRSAIKKGNCVKHRVKKKFASLKMDQDIADDIKRGVRRSGSFRGEKSYNMVIFGKKIEEEDSGSNLDGET